MAPRRFFLTLAGVRVVRFGAEATLALFYGDVIMSWMQSETVRTIAGILFVLVLVGAAFSSYELVRSTVGRRHRRSVRAQGPEMYRVHSKMRRVQFSSL